MTVNVSKPVVNVREKLAELDKPTGIAGEAMLRAETPQEQFNLIGAGRRNLIINGDMRIAQRGTSVTSSNDSNYRAVDRFVYDTRVNGASSGDFTLEQVTDAPTGFQYSYKITNVNNTTISSGGGVEFVQFVEGYDAAHLGWGTSGAKGVTFSFWVKASYTGTHSVYFPSSDYGIAWLDSFTIDAANTWEYKTFYISGPTSGTWNTTTGRGIMARINLCNGTTAGTKQTWNQSNTVVSDQTQTFGTTTSSTFQVTGVQLELGKVATPFEHRSYGEELALCQRYYSQIYYQWEGTMGDTGNFAPYTPVLPVTMRAAGTVTHTNASNGSAVSGHNQSSIDPYGLNTVFVVLNITGTGYGYYLADIAIDAEL